MPPELGTGHLAAVNRIRAVGETQCPQMGPLPGKGRILTDSLPTMHLDGLVGDSQRNLGGERLDHADPRGGLPPASPVHVPRGLQAQQPCRFDVCSCPGDNVVIPAKLSQRATECRP